MDNETNDNQQNSDNKSEMFELEKQLHAQYATNASANTSSFFAFLVSILAVFYAFGYVYIFNTNEFAADGKLFTINDGHVVFTLDVLAYIASISIILLAFLICYCLELSWQQRRDQLVIDNIRAKYHIKDDLEDLYSPHGKCWFDFVPNQYRYFILLFIIIMVIVVIFTTASMKLRANPCPLCTIPVGLFIACLLIGACTIIITWIIKYFKYIFESKRIEKIQETRKK